MCLYGLERPPHRQSLRDVQFTRLPSPSITAVTMRQPLGGERSRLSPCSPASQMLQHEEPSRLGLCRLLKTQPVIGTVFDDRFNLK